MHGFRLHLLIASILGIPALVLSAFDCLSKIQ